MALETTNNRVEYAGNGVTTVFSFPNKFFANADLVVIQKVDATGVETVKTLTTHYTLTGAGADDGGDVTMLVAPPTGQTLIVYRNPARTQVRDFVENDPLPVEELESGLDLLTALIQRLADVDSKTIKVSEGFSSSFNPVLPALLTAGAVIAIADNGLGLQLGPTIDEIGDAAAEAAAAAASAAAASASATAADASADAAAASAAAAATAAGTAIGKQVRNFAFADSPVTLAQSDQGKILVFNATNGNIVVNLPSVAGLDVSAPFLMALIKEDSTANTVTVNRNGTDTFNNGDTSKVLRSANEGMFLCPDTTPSPDEWAALPFGSSGGGAAGVPVIWQEDLDAPISSVENNQRIYSFVAALGQDLYALVKVPSSYVAGNQIRIRSSFYSGDSSGTVLLQTIATLVRAGTDVVSSTTNQRTSTNSAVTLAAGTVNEPQALSLDLTDSSGQINGVAAAAGDFIKVQLTRGTDTATGDAKFWAFGSEATFTT